MSKRIYLCLAILFCFIYSGFTQDTKEFKKMFTQAEELFLYEDYVNALPIYLDMVDKGYTNANIDFSLGMCYLYIKGGDKSKAIPYLESANLSVSSDYREGSYKENNAPEEAVFYLAKAYRVEHKFDKAIEYFEKYKSFLGVNEVYFIDFVNNQIDQCNNAKKLIKNPVSYTKTDLGSVINNEDDNYNPVLSADGTNLFFTTRMEIYDRVYDETNSFDFVYQSVKDGEKWTSPRDITKKIGSEGFCSPTHSNADGTKLLIFRDDWGVGNIYETSKQGRSWSVINKLDKNINTRNNEMYASYGVNESIIYFSSTRPDGYGGSDIYISVKDSKGKWGSPINLGQNINTPYNESSPFFLPEGEILFFSSEGHNSMGGYDIFNSTKQANGEWSVPLNVGYPINTTDDDLFYFPINNGHEALLAIYDENGSGNRNIYKIKIDDFIKLKKEPEEPETELIAENTEAQKDTVSTEPIAQIPDNTDATLKDNTSFISYGGDLYEEQPVNEEPETILSPKNVDYQIQGQINFQDNRQIASSANIQIFNTETNTLIDNINPASEDGVFTHSIKYGKYRLVVDREGYMQESKYVDIPLNYSQNTINVNITMIPKKVESGEYYVIKSVFFDYDKAILTRESKIELERLADIMDKNSSLYIEIVGHTDAKGSPQYNQNLSEQRARNVSKYITDKGIERSRFVAKGVGETDQLAIDINNDGTDNPEGMCYNRRVEINILKSANSNITVQNVDVPSRLRYKKPVYYTIWLTEVKKELDPSYFSKYPKHAINNVWMFPVQNGYMYTVGQYKHKSDAIAILNNAIDVGFPDAKIIDDAEFEKQKITGTVDYIEKKKKIAVEEKKGIYTIQLMALRNPVDISFFKNLTGVKKYKGSDDIHRYYCGSYKGIDAAKKASQEIINLGYTDAFVINTNKYK